MNTTAGVFVIIRHSMNIFIFLASSNEFRQKIKYIIFDAEWLILFKKTLYLLTVIIHYLSYELKLKNKNNIKIVHILIRIRIISLKKIFILTVLFQIILIDIQIGHVRSTTLNKIAPHQASLTAWTIAIHRYQLLYFLRTLSGKSLLIGLQKMLCHAVQMRHVITVQALANT